MEGKNKKEKKRTNKKDILTDINENNLRKYKNINIEILRKK